ncbi:acyl carrier protein [Luteolibacter pohnpeiensis]|uniref:Acyl carrier protein n=1 Tax=Luteolibacter pohnpeiensis TaxID=454153 RepID=A0A934VVX3_9BACT|nr:acyl carrier protein [Luteolibacter pohnpeiensis]MBK1882218.1 acyl carrier protein [Luteolibacter pohnpeiensis]
MMAPRSVFGMVNASEVLDWLSAEELLEIEDGFPEDGDLFAAGLDSMAVMQLVVLAEEKYGVVLGPADINRENLATAQALAELICRKQS